MARRKPMSFRADSTPGLSPEPPSNCGARVQPDRGPLPDLSAGGPDGRLDDSDLRRGLVIAVLAIFAKASTAKQRTELRRALGSDDDASDVLMRLDLLARPLVRW